MVQERGARAQCRRHHPPPPANALRTSSCSTPRKPHGNILIPHSLVRQTEQDNSSYLGARDDLAGTVPCKYHDPSEIGPQCLGGRCGGPHTGEGILFACVEWKEP